MGIVDYVKDGRNKIVVSGASAVGLIIMAAAGVSLLTPAKQVKDSNGQVTHEITLGGATRQSGALVTRGVIASPTLANCDTIDGTSTGMLVCGTDTGGGSATGFNSGQVLAIGDRRYVKKQGDTMTGALAINVTGGNFNTLGLRVINTMSGAHVHAEQLLTSSGTLVTESGASIGNTLFVASQNGRVGIGTSNPTAILHVRTDTNAQIRIERPSAANNSGNNPTFVFLLNGGATAAGYFGMAGGTNGLITGSVQGDLNVRSTNKNILFSADDGTTAHMYIKSTGLVSIGNTAPKTKLEVVGTISGSALVINGGATFDTDVLRVDSVNNRVGIGTSAPKAKLDVVGTISGATLTTSGVPAAAIGKVKCYKPGGVEGYCSSAVDSGGACTCN